jgi:cytochrome-b5 reductase
MKSTPEEAMGLISMDEEAMGFLSMDEVTKHKTKDDLWMVIHNKVYSVADYLDEHPGGEQILLDTAGTDATTAFEDIGHSEDAREKLAKYVIGVLPLSVSYDLFP